MDIPGATQHLEAEKAGYLSKLSGRSFPYIPQWKRRYCVLARGRLYYYEREDSRQGEKSNGVINLEYFDQVTEAAPKDCKKATNVFIITSQDRSFFDPGRHLFSADTLPDMKDWIRRLQTALEQIRNNNRPAAATSSPAPAPAPAPATKESGKKRKEESTAETKEDRENKENQQNISTKERKKKKEDSHRPRKSARTGVSSETQTSMTDSAPAAGETEAGTHTMASPRGGVQLPGLSAQKAKQGAKTSKSVQPPVTRPQGMNQRKDEDMTHMKVGPTLSCVTKQRVKGPQGRRAPQSSRRTAMALKKRASSLSALEHQDAGDNSEAPWLNRSLDVLEAEQSHPPQARSQYKAYNYSSDEEDLEDDHNDSFITSASGMPPPPPPRSASYGLDMRPSCHPVGLLGCQALHRSLGDGQGSHDNLAGSKHSLREWVGGPGVAWGGSRGSLGQNGEISGGASPVMDDLDNLLMNQSLQHSAPTREHLSDETSEGSTCRAVNQPHSLPQHAHHHHSHELHKKSQDLRRFTAAVQHLQRHVVEIDQAVLAMTGEVGGTRQEVTSLKEAVTALQADTHTITTTLSGLTQQAITVQHNITQATQEAERMQQAATAALREAEQARQEQLRVRQEYEYLLGEVRSTLHSLKYLQDTGKDSKGTGKDTKGTAKGSEEEGRTATSFVGSLGGSRGSGGSWTGPVLVSKSSSASQGEKTVPTYQSLFSKPSSIISGLTSRHSLTKAVSFADQKNKRKNDSAVEAKSGSLDRKKEDKSLIRQKDKASKKEDRSFNSLERKEKESRQHDSLERRDKKDKEKKEGKQSKERGSSLERWGWTSKHDKQGAVISGLSDDDIPMADDSIHEGLRPGPPATTKVSTSKLTLNFSLGKSSSSPTVPYASAASQPPPLPLSRDRQSSELSISNTTPESPTAPSPFPRPGSGTLPPLEESPPVSEVEAPSGPLFHRPGSTPGPLARQGSMTTVPEDREVTGPPSSKRSGVFAISRQHSSPNIPLQRQGSGSMFPLQRQGSLGLVPEGRLPRQESLTSVPEDRAVVDRTLPLSPSPSMSYFPLSPSASLSMVSESMRQARESMELVTGPVLAGSSMQEAAATGTLPVLRLTDEDEPPAATSSLKKNHKSHSNVVGVLV